MKNYIRIAALSLSLAGASYAAPFMAIGDGAELFLTGTLGVRVDDNIYLASKETNDVIFDIAPGAEIAFGKNAQLKGKLALALAFANYSDNSSLNTNLFSGDFDTRFDDGKMKLGFNAFYHELNQNTADNRGLTRRDVFSTGGNTEVEVSQLSSVEAKVNFTHENYKRRGYTDSDTLTVPLNFYYKWMPKLDLSFGYQYRQQNVDIGLDSTDHFFNVGARGEIAPKLKGAVRAGLGVRNLSPGGDRNLFGLDSSLTYEFSEKTNLLFNVSNDFGTSPQGQQQKNFNIGGTVDTRLSAEWSANFGLSWRAISYDAIPAVTTTTGTTVRVISPGIASRTDDYFEMTLGATYVISANVKLAGGYTYRDYKSDLSASEFSNNVFSISANFRY